MRQYQRRILITAAAVALAVTPAFAGEKSILWVGRGKLAARPAASRNTVGRLYVVTNCATAACTTTATTGERHCETQDTGTGWDVIACGSTTTTTTTTSTTTTT